MKSTQELLSLSNEIHSRKGVLEWISLLKSADEKARYKA